MKKYETIDPRLLREAAEEIQRRNDQIHNPQQGKPVMEILREQTFGAPRNSAPPTRAPWDII